MRHLYLASTGLLALAAAMPAAAQTKIETATTTPVTTATIKAGTPDDILVTSAGSIGGTGPVAITINSNNKVTNQGSISLGGVANATGILANAGVTSEIVNSGKITLDEAYTPTDADNDGDLDGPFAVGSGRVAIRTLGAFAGNITNSGQIVVEGNDSAGILLGGPLTGNFANNGSINVLGTNALGIGLGDVTGKVRVAGTVLAQGQNATAFRSAGNVTGAMEIQGTITATGYRYTQAPADPSKLDADDLLQGGPAVSIEGNVSGGVILAVPPKDTSTTNNDEDNDGIEDSKEGTASVTSFGSAAALRIGHASNSVAIGPVAGTGTGFGLIVDGNVTGDGVYTGVNGNAIQVGGLGGTVSIANGIGINGTVTAKSLDRTATAISLGAGATTPELRNAGKVIALSGNNAQAKANAVSVGVGANLPILRNSGEISASIGNVDGSATAILDTSGTLALIENSGAIIAKGAAATSSRNVAIDLSANTAGAAIRQTAVAATAAAPSIIGDIRLGSGNDVLDVADGVQTGNVSFGAGTNRYALSGDAVATGNVGFGSGNDTLTLAGTSSLSGNIDFGGGADVLTLTGKTAYTGQLLNASGLGVSVAQGTLNIRKSATIASLTVTDGGVLGVFLDKTAGASTAINVTGTASFATGTKLQLSVSDIANAEGTYNVLTAGTLTGASNLAATTDLLPFIYKGTLTTSANALSVSITRKSATELGLNRSETAAYSAIYTALGTDKAIGDSILGIRSGDAFRSTIQQMLPEHAGGAFEAVTAGSRAAARLLTDPTSPYKEQGRMAYWISQVAWGSSKSIGDTASFKTGGWGVDGGADVATPLGRVGASLSYLFGQDKNKETDGDISANQYGVAAHWRMQSKGFQASARVGWARINFDGRRSFRSTTGPTPVDRQIDSDWSGDLVTASAHLAQQLWAGRLYVRPTVDLDYAKLKEDGYVETGGGTALDLTVDKRTSDELAVSGILAAGIEFAPERQDGGFFTVELQGGRREIVSGSLGNTVARFGTGTAFTLEPEQRKSGWVGGLRALGGNSDFRVVGDVTAEEREERVALSARVSLALGF
ncbi:autotransporter outer membrane beta-barrel domain-containing protein [Sphingomonas astaxanthinifaciens]|uniref:Autotransporter n=1 Tax=Sphingomonas astaxanthinifaciens DSM 22298 TaxID=1123267 RepID=A0ABQ5ZCK9_9SPHN|nr:autotransporter outer membrane beta-barrel domain-containing protein [Sphingomonas astaxanthinifaciens]GLR48534.1 autotransporter [Sphingomonas astaxanthinifaciens DSM 22298]